MYWGALLSCCGTGCFDAVMLLMALPEPDSVCLRCHVLLCVRLRRRGNVNDNLTVTRFGVLGWHVLLYVLRLERGHFCEFCDRGVEIKVGCIGLVEFGGFNIASRCGIHEATTGIEFAIYSLVVVEGRGRWARGTWESPGHRHHCRNLKAWMGS